MLWYSHAPQGDLRRDSPNSRLVTQGTHAWAVVAQNVVAAEAVENHDDFGGIFCYTLDSLQDVLAEAGVPIPASWLPLTTGRAAPAGEAFDQSAPRPGLVLVDGAPQLALFWHDGPVSAGVVVNGWTAVGFVYPKGYQGHIALETLRAQGSNY